MKSSKLPLFLLVGSLGIIMALLIMLFEGVNLQVVTGPFEASLITVFLTGLLAGGITCLAVQGGLLASSIAQREQKKLEGKMSSTGHALPIIIFLFSKLIAYTILGFLLGLLGSVMELSLQARIILQFAVVIFMIGVALNLLQVHPVFRYFAIQPPRFVLRLIRSESKDSSFFAPAFLGGLTAFIPCGTTQAMMALSLATGNALYGAAILFVFVLGTSPVFFILGYFASKMSGKLSGGFTKIAATVIILLALYNLDGTLALSGSKITTRSLFAQTTNTSQNIKPVDKAEIMILQSGYSPNSITVQRSSTVTLSIKNIDGYGCQQAFVIPSMNYQKIISPGMEEKLTISIPDKTGDIPFMCSMGMYRGVIHVI